MYLTNDFSSRDILVHGQSPKGRGNTPLTKCLCYPSMSKSSPNTNCTKTLVPAVLQCSPGTQELCWELEHSAGSGHWGDCRRAEGMGSSCANLLIFSFLGPKSLCLSTFDIGEENGGNSLWLLQLMLHAGPITPVCAGLWNYQVLFLNPFVVFDSFQSSTAGKKIISCCISTKYLDGLAFD